MTDKNATKRDYTKAWVLFLAVAIIFSVVLLGCLTTHFLKSVSSEKCVAANDIIEVFGGIRVKCQVLSPVQLASWYASCASVLVIVFLTAAFIIQSLQLSAQKTEFRLSQVENAKMFTEQRNWDKSKLVLETIVEIRQVSSKYLISPPSVIKKKLPPHLENTQFLTGFINDLASVKKEDFLPTQATRHSIEGDKLKLITYLELVCNLLSIDAVLENTTLNHIDREQLNKSSNNLTVT